MADDVIVNKAATVERCIRHIQEDYDTEFRTNFTKQDAVILNLERACQACIDIASHVVKSRKLGVPQISRELFTLLAERQIIPVSLAENLQGMVSFRNIAVHDYAVLNLDIVISGKTFNRFY
ncbi:type VII toxin-antitoxin system HepT family RNase toxin [Tunicatimonas pelagia]|uniref:type VII toxin-antitoxin system HepT family RNase toxin n=1 Tax=Tunicatimonas pelagia TaxID=931531 RepID=UPI0026668F4C|nr:DUF86 domain-containing protein [Tunicatimonas pelagia]WKN40633.1 DUF86 domain-containing protein [Tunicatimonas pelagia]